MSRVSRETDVLAVLSPVAGFSPVAVARFLNLDESCDWCAVHPGYPLATVPADSRCRVRRVLERLVRQGKAIRIVPVRRGVYMRAVG